MFHSACVYIAVEYSKNSLQVVFELYSVGSERGLQDMLEEWQEKGSAKSEEILGLTRYNIASAGAKWNVREEE